MPGWQFKNKALDKKYEFVGKKNSDGLRRIRALRDFGNIKKGQLGGYVESDENLSHEGDCWIADEAIVSCGARISGNALVHGYALVSGNAKISGDAIVGGWIEIAGDAQISGCTHTTAPRPDLGRPFKPGPSGSSFRP